jgi:beta-glucosidase
VQVLALRMPTVLVLVHGGTISLGPLKSSSPAIVDAFYGGEMAAAALASVLFGETNPSGRMVSERPVPDCTSPSTTYFKYLVNQHELNCGGW